METVKNQDIYSLKKIYIVEKRTRESIHEIWFEIDVCIFLSQFRMYLDAKNPKKLLGRYMHVPHTKSPILWMCRRHAMIPLSS